MFEVTSFYSIVYKNIMDFFMSLISLFRPMIGKKAKIEPIKKDKVFSFLDTIERYMEKEKKRFASLFEETSQNYNENTDPLFYQMENYENMIVESDNVLENQWKRKILMENTPIGNVIMYYNVYKRGFSYYSDVHVSYTLLNTIAMKYVRLFCCRDLFVDDMFTPAENPSPLIRLEQEYEKEKEKKDKKDTTPHVVKKGPFLKNKSGILKVMGEKKAQDENPKHLYNVNRFLYMGKISNFSFTQKVEKRSNIPPFHKSSFEGLFDKEHDLQEQVFSYRDYKKLRNSSTT